MSSEGTSKKNEPGLAERLEVVDKIMSPGICLSKLLKYADVSRSTWYYFKKIKPKDKRSENKGRHPLGYTINRDGSVISDKDIIIKLEKYRDEIEFKNGGGYIKLTHYLKREHGLYVNKKKIYRLCKENSLLLPQRKKAKKSWKSINKNHIITSPNKLWEFGIKYGFIHGENKFFFVLSFVDVFSRKVVGNYVGSRCQVGDLTFTLNEAIKDEGLNLEEYSLIIRSDNGSQMSSLNFYKYLEKLEGKLCHEFIPPATPNKNAHVESFFSILETEFIQTHYFKTLSEAYVRTHNFIKFYNERRVHSSLKYKTPNEIMLDYKIGENFVQFKGVSPIRQK